MNDGTTKLFLSTKGEADDVSKPLKMFLDYVDGKKPEDALMQEIDHEVDTVKHCDEWRRDYMTLALEMDKKWREGKAEGKIEAIRNAIKDGLTTLTWAPRCFLGAFSYGIFKALIYALCRKLV